MLGLYRFLTYLLAPAAALWLKRRQLVGKEDATRLRERYGYAARTRPDGALLWIHAASVGESLSILPLLERLLNAQSGLHALITTGTVTSARLLAERLPARAFHHYAPIDTPWAVRRFLAHWRPNAACWVESELWPNLLLGTHATGCPMALLNARLSERSFRRWGRQRGAARRLLGCFSLIFAQSAEDAQRIRELGGRDVRVSGNVKFDAPVLPDFPEKHAALSRAIGSRPLWLAASTHPGEEALVARAHKRMKQTHPRLLTVIVPRHPDRGALLAQELQTMGLGVVRRSLDQPVAPATDIYLADTMGELGIFYRLCPISFIGGSLVPHGGQNPLEAARLGSAILAGPHMHNFAEIAAALLQQEAMRHIGSVDELAAAVEGLLNDPALRQRYADNALRAVKAQQGATDAMAAELLPLLAQLGKASHPLDAFLPQAS